MFSFFGIQLPDSRLFYLMIHPGKGPAVFFFLDKLIETGGNLFGALPHTSMP